MSLNWKKLRSSYPYTNGQPFSFCINEIHTENHPICETPVSEGENAFIIPVARTGGCDGKVSVKYAGMSATAVAGIDYSGGDGVLTWVHGDCELEFIELSITKDREKETTETIHLKLFEAAGGAALGVQAETRTDIIDVPPKPGILQFGAAVYDTDELAGELTIPVKRVEGCDGEVSVKHEARGNSTAIADVDYTGANGVLIWADGECESKNVVLSLEPDKRTEKTETVHMMLYEPAGDATLGGVAETRIEIIDVPPLPGELAFEEAFYSVNEGHGRLEIPVNRPPASGCEGRVSVRYSATGRGAAAAGLDYTGDNNGVLVWEHGECGTNTIELSIEKDGEKEETEMASLMLFEFTGGATPGALTETDIQIIDVPPQPGILQFEKASYTVWEDDGTISIPITREAGCDGEVSVQYTITAEGTTASGDDYTGGSSELTWVDGDCEPESFLLSVNDDDRAEASETIRLLLVNFTGGAGQGTPMQTSVNILDNDTPLPDLGSGLGVTASGILVASGAKFKGGTTVSAKKYRSVKALKSSEIMTITGEIEADPAHAGQTADIFIVAGYTPFEPGAKEIFGMGADTGSESHGWVLWEPEIATLAAAYPKVSLTAKLRVNIYSGPLPPGQIRIFFGYRLESGLLVFNGEEAIEITAAKEEWGHRIAFSPDGRQVLTAFAENEVRLWDADSGELFAALTGHDDVVWHAAFSPDGKQAVTASADHTARLWDTESGEALFTLSGHGDDVWHAAFSSDGLHVLTASWDNTARIWDTHNGEPLIELKGHDKKLWHAGFSDDGQQALTASEDNTVRLWDAHSGEALAVLSGHEGPVYQAVFSTDGMLVLSASADGAARLWDADGELLVFPGHESGVRLAMFAPDEQSVIALADDGALRQWDISGTELPAIEENGIFHFAFSSDGAHAVTASDEGTVLLREMPVGGQYSVLAGHDSAVYQAVFSPDNRYAATLSGDKTARLWDVDTGEQYMILTERSQ
ncbi:MAG: hypothetical protein GY862_35880 [Gammaproteobacteria bacterium]|nr:hypothetical protein [Gammaproteobacteria bacterium]